MIQLSVPGNLLLFGEFAVTTEGGKGIAVAVDCLAKFKSFPDDTLSFRCLFGNQEISWKEGDPFPKSFGLIKTILTAFPHVISPQKILIDTTEFFYPDGRKKGFGSSAAVAVGLTAALFAALPNKEQLLSQIFSTSLEIHRRFQGKRGSGYDIAASLFGGMGLFTGGAKPLWEPLFLPWLEKLILIRGDKPVSTKTLIAAFEEFQKNFPKKTEEFLKNSNALVESISSCKEERLANQHFLKGAKINQAIHENFGAISEGPMLKRKLDFYREQGIAAKPLGAGGEIAAVFKMPQTSLKEGEEPLLFSKQGLRWQ